MKPSLYAACSVLAATLLSWLASSGVAQACAVCGGNTPERTKVAFIVTTALLTFLPLGMMGGLIYWIRKRVREIDAAANQAGER